MAHWVEALEGKVSLSELEQALFVRGKGKDDDE
jgi:hypothetical protein